MNEEQKRKDPANRVNEPLGGIKGAGERGTVTYLHDYGRVELVDYMGSDDSIAEAARLSYATGTKRVRNNEGLIRYLMRHSHTGPFEQAELIFSVQAPIFVARQLMRTRTANLNETSLRYSEADFPAYMPDNLRSQGGAANKQQSGDELPDNVNREAKHIIEAAYRSSRLLNAELRELGVCREQARMVMPTGQYTRFMFKIDLHNLLRMLKNRLSSDAQSETGDYAYVMSLHVCKLFPVTWSAFHDYEINAIKLTTLDSLLMNELDRYTVAGTIPDPTKFEVVADEAKAKALGYSISEIKEGLLRLEKIMSCRRDWQTHKGLGGLLAPIKDSEV